MNKTGILFDGLSFREEKMNKIKKEINVFKNKPKLGIIYAGDNLESSLYIKHKIDAANKVGIACDLYHHPNPTTNELLKQIEHYNNNDDINGILVQLPLPKNIDKIKIFEAIKPCKDVDGFTSYNKGLADNNNQMFLPATAIAVIEILKLSFKQIQGKNVAIIGYSDLLGKPLVKYLGTQEATIFIFNKYSINFKSFLKDMDIIISSVGQPDLFDSSDIKEGSVIIGVGNKKNNDHVLGDFVHDELIKKASFVTPTPNGVGPLTVYYLLENVLKAYKNQNK